jgi:hypothetical protein
MKKVNVFEFTPFTTGVPWVGETRAQKKLSLFT